ncbi:hypothetical protein SAMN05428957_101289 [Oryzisolibacter propanilivorax]|uniref:TolA protein n=1 Tax=Oryzisolibacter propanilivorax TaxID=1527607 RepID=A0A1G9PBV2_9BURK|nr:hypothetical protein [Oryzisolibacter propanilivorax]SDL95697.1 hypothetical protein SAMN05428957_101289 [Oryzisolibacter propanilivorax]
MQRLSFVVPAAALWLALAAAQPSIAQPSGAQPMAERAAVRERIQHQRRDIQAELARQEAACYQRFAVEDCLRQVRSDARTRDNLLWREELELDEAERRDKAAQRLQSIEQRQREPAIQPPAPAAARQEAAEDGERRQQAQERAEHAERHRAEHAAAQQRRAQEQAERLEASRQRHEERQRKARERREQQERRRAEDAAAGKTPARPLPAEP